ADRSSSAASLPAARRLESFVAGRRSRDFGSRRRGGDALQVGVEAHGVGFAQAGAVDLDVGEHLLHVLPRLLEGDAVDPVDRIDLAVAGVAELLDPFPRAAGPGV